MSHWLGSAPRSTLDADTAASRAAELRAEAARFDIIGDMLARAHGAMPNALECEGWLGRTRTAFDARLAVLASETLKGSHYAGIISEACTTMAREEEDRAALLSARGAAP